MFAVQIDMEIRKALESDLYTADDKDAIIGHYLPLMVNPAVWIKVKEYAMDVCDNPGGGADCRPGRLYELTDEEIVEAEKWLKEHSSVQDWEDLQQTFAAGGPDVPYPAALKYIDAAFLR